MPSVDDIKMERIRINMKSCAKLDELISDMVELNNLVAAAQLQQVLDALREQIILDQV
jgi:outer membrane murein-binding lipoprotein Lpp